MGKITCPNQASFVSARPNIDNIVVVQKMLCHFNKYKSIKE